MHNEKMLFIATYAQDVILNIAMIFGNSGDIFPTIFSLIMSVSLE